MSIKLTHLQRRYHRPYQRGITRRHSRGFSIVELLVGVAIGLFILTGASLIYVNNLGNSRLLLIQARMDQDLRSAMDLITRDLRRGAYWGESLSGVTVNASGAVAATNPFAVVAASASDIAYRYDNPASSVPFDSSRAFGFRLRSVTTETPQGGRIEMNIGNTGGGENWNAVTDLKTMSVTSFVITEDATAIDTSTACEIVCTNGEDCPHITVRTYNIVLTGSSQVDPSMVRTLRSQVRVRNDAIEGSCS